VADDDHVPVNLTGVPETLLWNLYYRSIAARNPDRTGLHDPKAINLVERLDYPFARFDVSHSAVTAQWHALRVRTFDEEIRRLAAADPGATVVALGEGLETQFWRVDGGRLNWVSVDLPETIALRRELLPDEARLRSVANSATEPAWTEQLDPDRGLIVTAQGLLMYFTQREVDDFLGMCAERIPAATLLFDAVPEHMARARERGSGGGDYRPPAWTWTVTPRELQRLAKLPAVAELHAVPVPRGRGLVFGAVLPALCRVPGVRDRLPVFPVRRARFR
jgi:O-methyltransferase involved in polyketide biosynthesis